MHLGTTADWEVWHSLGLTSRSVPSGKGPWEARCIGFRSKEGPQYPFLTKCQEPAGTQAGAKSAWEASGSCLLAKQQKTYTRGWESVHDSSPGLYCVDFVEAYVTQKNVSSRISQGKVWFAFAQRMFAQETFAEKGKTGKESQYYFLYQVSMI
jgi:hypothetical protein